MAEWQDDDFDRELTKDEQILWDTMGFEDDPNFDKSYWVERGMNIVRDLMAKMWPFEPAPTASEYAWW